MTEQHIDAINEIANLVHENAIAHGFHNFEEDEGQFIARTVANIHGEASELWEAYRKHELHNSCDKTPELSCAAEELADLIIRTMDTARRLGVNIGRAVAIKHGYNITRSFRHGNKAA